MNWLHARGLVLATLGGMAVLLLLAAPASAHVTVNPSTATQGSYAKLTFRVPTEVDNASTVKVQVFLPAAQPLASVSVKPHPGWSVKVVRSGDAVSQISWTANSPANAIGPGEFDEFDISAGPLPRTRSMEFKALQTYSDGHVVRWIQDQTAGTEPEHPAPVLTLVAAGKTQDSRETAAPAASTSGTGTAALWLSVAALVIAVAAAVGTVLSRPRH